MTSKPASKKTEFKIKSNEIPNISLTEDNYSYYQQCFTDKFYDEYKSDVPFSNQTLPFYTETQRINDQKRNEFRDNFRDTHSYDKDYFFTAVREFTKRNRRRSYKGNSRRRSSSSDVSTEKDRELALSDDAVFDSLASTSNQDLINADLVSTFSSSVNQPFSVTSDQTRPKTHLTTKN